MKPNWKIIIPIILAYIAVVSVIAYSNGLPFTSVVLTYGLMFLFLVIGLAALAIVLYISAAILTILGLEDLSESCGVIMHNFDALFVSLVFLLLILLPKGMLNM